MSALGRLAAATLLIVLAAPNAARAGDLAIVIAGVPNDRGSVRLSVCDRATFLGDCAFNRIVGARAGTVEITVTGVPRGRFAVLAHHDENTDGKVDTNFFGAPTESIGFSNDASARWGPPRFDDAAIEVTDAPLALRITLRR